MLVENIKSMCKSKNITIAELERSVRFGNGTIARWDCKRPSIDRVKNVADFFGVSMDKLLSDHKEG